MWPDRVSNTGPLFYESGALPTALRGLATQKEITSQADSYLAILSSKTCVLKTK